MSFAQGLIPHKNFTQVHLWGLINIKILGYSPYYQAGRKAGTKGTKERVDTQQNTYAGECVRGGSAQKEMMEAYIFLNQTLFCPRTVLVTLRTRTWTRHVDRLTKKLKRNLPDKYPFHDGNGRAWAFKTRQVWKRNELGCR